ncbi:MAG: methyltransferase domain-containing protein [Bacteroidetes bacterium]|nr:MAG: methyltransferase domain-containing protein [Bacteroidota bacterium]
MRIIGGDLGGRKIAPPAKMPYTRPTTDVAKEGLFNILQNQVDFEGIATLDLFGGTGAISYELASRGATALTIVEKDPVMFQFIKSNIEKLGIAGAILLKADVFKFLQTASETYDFIFAGPPYALNTIDDLPKLILEKQLLAPDGLFVLEHTPRNQYAAFKGFVKQRHYGTTVFSFFEAV